MSADHERSVVRRPEDRRALRPVDARGARGPGHEARGVLRCDRMILGRALYKILLFETVVLACFFVHLSLLCGEIVVKNHEIVGLREEFGQLAVLFQERDELWRWPIVRELPWFYVFCLQ